MMYAYIACELFTNLETFSTLIDFQKKYYGKYTPKAVFVAGLYILSITPTIYRIIFISRETTLHGYICFRNM
jgi:hypothetical protein